MFPATPPQIYRVGLRCKEKIPFYFPADCKAESTISISICQQSEGSLVEGVPCSIIFKLKYLLPFECLYTLTEPLENASKNDDWSEDIP